MKVFKLKSVLIIAMLFFFVIGQETNTETQPEKTVPNEEEIKKEEPKVNARTKKDEDMKRESKLFKV